MAVYLVITEEWYGGGDKIRIFADEMSANNYKKELEDKHNLDVIVQRKTIDNSIIIDKTEYGGQIRRYENKELSDQFGRG